MVNLTRIYTRTGDAGTTRLSDNSVAAKTDARVQAYGHIDEANSVLGLVTTQSDLPDDIREVLRHIQNELFDCGADLSNPLKESYEVEPLRIIEENVERLEAWCDQYGDHLPPLRSFVLPGGTQTSAWLHLARTIVRRAERTAWAAASVYGTSTATDTTPGGVNVAAITYLNRLSDLLFILARLAGQEAGEVLWVPGKDRQPPDPAAARERDRIAASQQAINEAEQVTAEDGAVVEDVPANENVAADEAVPTQGVEAAVPGRDDAESAQE
jgi:cob(I)alamin adenosyltransferase